MNDNQDDIQPLIISTDGLPENKGFELWREGVFRSFAAMRLERKADQPFFGRAEIYGFDNLQFGTVHSSPQRGFIERPNKELLAVNLQLAGTSIGRQGKDRWIAYPGDVDIIDTSQPAELGMDENCRSFIMLIPHYMLRRTIRNLDRLSGMRLKGDKIEDALVKDYLERLAKWPGFPARGAGSIVNNFLPVLAAALCPSDDTREQAKIGKRELHRQRAIGYMERNLPDPSLSPEKVATHCSMSERNLNALFKEIGTTVMRVVYELRLERCKEDLANPAMRKRTILEIAVAWGFQDLSHFDRRFKKAYKMTPRDWSRANDLPR